MTRRDFETEPGIDDGEILAPDPFDLDDEISDLPTVSVDADQGQEQDGPGLLGSLIGAVRSRFQSPINRYGYSFQIDRIDRRSGNTAYWELHDSEGRLVTRDLSYSSGIFEIGAILKARRQANIRVTLIEKPEQYWSKDKLPGGHTLVTRRSPDTGTGELLWRIEDSEGAIVRTGTSEDSYFGFYGKSRANARDSANSFLRKRNRS